LTGVSHGITRPGSSVLELNQDGDESHRQGEGVGSTSSSDQDFLGSGHISGEGGSSVTVSESDCSTVTSSGGDHYIRLLPIKLRGKSPATGGGNRPQASACCEVIIIAEFFIQCNHFSRIRGVTSGGEVQGNISECACHSNFDLASGRAAKVSSDVLTINLSEA